jgi:hypothetical protein
MVNSRLIQQLPRALILRLIPVEETAGVADFWGTAAASSVRVGRV